MKLFFFESACHIAQADLELATSLKLTLSSCSSHLHLKC